MKKTVIMLIGITLIAFGVGFLALNYGSNFEINIVPNEKQSIAKFFDANINKKNMFIENIDEEKIETANGIENINIETPFVDVNIISENRDDVRIHYNGSIQSNYIPELKTNIKGKNLYISATKGGINSYNVYKTDLKLDIYIPTDFEDNIEISTSSGDINLSNLNLYKLNVVASSGDVKLSNLYANSLSIKTTSGEQWGENLEIEQSKFLASSGDIQVYDLITQSLFVETSSGEQEFKKLESEKSTFLASSGDIEIYGNTGDVDITTSSGNIELNYDVFYNNITITASSGDVDIILPKDAEFNIKASTTSGDIGSSFPVTVTGKLKNNLNGKVGNSNNTININTTSGDISIEK
ncbi:MAG: DUF4097 domain-containing protein [Tissierellia bacterium]|nr:DUF4097 domain-containing protein [Tissierellia bacterium]